MTDLMRNAQEKLPPKKIIDKYIAKGGKANNTTYKALYDAYGDATAELWLMGSSTLAALWESAWKEGAGSTLPVPGDLREYQPDELMGPVPGFAVSEIVLPCGYQASAVGNTLVTDEAG